jgi:hypothetical protein
VAQEGVQKQNDQNPKDSKHEEEEKIEEPPDDNTLVNDSQCLFDGHNLLTSSKDLDLKVVR